MKIYLVVYTYGASTENHIVISAASPEAARDTFKAMRPATPVVSVWERVL